MAQGLRFDQLCTSQGLTPHQVAQILHVSLRTVHNWRAGVHPVPYMAFKLLRILRYLEIPFVGWDGWHFAAGKLYSPEGRSFVGTDSAWWSLLVRRATGFSAVYDELVQTRGEVAAWRSTAGHLRAAASGSAPPADAATQAEMLVTPQPSLTGETFLAFVTDPAEMLVTPQPSAKSGTPGLRRVA